MLFVSDFIASLAGHFFICNDFYYLYCDSSITSKDSSWILLVVLIRLLTSFNRHKFYTDVQYIWSFQPIFSCSCILHLSSLSTELESERRHLSCAELFLNSVYLNQWKVSILHPPNNLASLHALNPQRHGNKLIKIFLVFRLQLSVA